ncbi:hypothetical protein [Dactylosporangium sp. NPDC051541]|uniref:hypothetical protein n=1 Tax=Dactylosporangium sp. NPDC051541 TaxID=3363977 RepID=UPI0037BC74C4
MEQLPVDTPRGTAVPLAVLSIEPAEVTALLGLPFVEVANDLGPATLALIRLADGTLIAFARLLQDVGPRVDVYHYDGYARHPRPLPDALLRETGLAAELVTWVGED